MKHKFISILTSFCLETRLLIIAIIGTAFVVIPANPNIPVNNHWYYLVFSYPKSIILAFFAVFVGWLIFTNRAKNFKNLVGASGIDSGRFILICGYL